MIAAVLRVAKYRAEERPRRGARSAVLLVLQFRQGAQNVQRARCVAAAVVAIRAVPTARCLHGAAPN